MPFSRYVTASRTRATTIAPPPAAGTTTTAVHSVCQVYEVSQRATLILIVEEPKAVRLSMTCSRSNVIAKAEAGE